MANGSRGEGRRPPARITARYLQWVTERYLERYATSTQHLRRLLMQRVRRSVAHHGDDPDAAAALVDAEIGRLSGIGLLDDARFARDRARVLARRGNGARAIRAKLGEKGLRGDAVEDALAALSADGADPELEAARRWARKRRLGPWARQPADPEARKKQLARFGRAGFSYEIAVRVLDAPPEDA